MKVASGRASVTANSTFECFGYPRSRSAATVQVAVAAVALFKSSSSFKHLRRGRVNARCVARPRSLELLSHNVPLA